MILVEFILHISHKYCHNLTHSNFTDLYYPDSSGYMIEPVDDFIRDLRN
jgi:hypothetical protein